MFSDLSNLRSLQRARHAGIAPNIDKWLRKLPRNFEFVSHIAGEWANHIAFLMFI